MKILFFDTETTGLDSKVHGIHQLAGEVVFNDEVIETFDYRIKPFKGCKIDPKALEISRTSRSDLSKYQPEEDALFDFQGTINNCIAPHLNDRIFLAGWRVPEFDNKFLQALFERHNAMADFKSFFWSNPIDVKTLATQYLIDKRTEMESFSLVSVAKYMGIEVDESKLHSAAYDAYLSRIIYNIVKG
jgi:DNA polymerase III alpha subunit (gram-positive type)